jgi:hypothetical protein
MIPSDNHLDGGGGGGGGSAALESSMLAAACVPKVIAWLCRARAADGKRLRSFL